MIKIKITDVELFSELLNGLVNLVNECKFEISETNCKILVKNNSETIRAFLETDVFVSSEPVSICLNDLRKFSKSINVLSEFSKNKIINLEFDNVFLKCKDIIKFKLKTVKEIVIENVITKPLKLKLTPVFSCKILNIFIKKMLSMSFISSSEEPKIYIYKENNKIVGEIDEKQLHNSLSDSISLPLTTEFEGDWNKIIITKLDTFRVWNLLNSESINIEMTKQGAVQVQSDKVSKETKKFIKLLIISKVLKQ